MAMTDDGHGHPRNMLSMSADDDVQEQDDKPEYRISNDNSDALGEQSKQHVRRASTFGTDMHINDEWNVLRYRIALVLTSKPFEVTMSLIIVFNMGFVIFVTNLSAEISENDGVMPTWVEAVSHFLLSIYTVECICKLYAFQREYFDHPSNWMDLILIIVDFLTIGLEVIFGDLPSATVLRILRLLRLMRAGRILSNIPELYVMVTGMVSTVRAMMCATLLIIMMLALWSIIAVEFLNPLARDMDRRGEFGDCGRCGRSFSNVWDSMLTFFTSVVAGDSWGQVATPMIEEQPACLLVFIPVIVTVNLGLLNLLLTAIVNQAQIARDEDLQHKLHDKQEKFKKLKQKLFVICEQMDSDQNGALSYDEIIDGYDSNDSFSDQLKLMDVGRADLQLVFKFLDSDDSGEVSYLEFVDQLYLLKAKSTHTLLVFIKQYVCEMKKQMVCLEQSIKDNLPDSKDASSALTKVAQDATAALARVCEMPEKLAEISQATPTKEEKIRQEQKSQPDLSGFSSAANATSGSSSTQAREPALEQARQTMDTEVSIVLQDIAVKSQSLLQVLSNSRGEALEAKWNLPLPPVESRVDPAVQSAPHAREPPMPLFPMTRSCCGGTMHGPAPVIAVRPI